MFTTFPKTLPFGIAKDGVEGSKIQVGKASLVSRLRRQIPKDEGKIAKLQSRASRHVTVLASAGLLHIVAKL